MLSPGGFARSCPVFFSEFMWRRCNASNVSNASYASNASCVVNVIYVKFQVISTIFLLYFLYIAFFVFSLNKIFIYLQNVLVCFDLSCGGYWLVIHGLYKRIFDLKICNN